MQPAEPAGGDLQEGKRRREAANVKWMARNFEIGGKKVKEKEGGRGNERQRRQKEQPARIEWDNRRKGAALSCGFLRRPLSLGSFTTLKNAPLVRSTSHPFPKVEYTQQQVTIR